MILLHLPLEARIRFYCWSGLTRREIQPFHTSREQAVRYNIQQNVMNYNLKTNIHSYHLETHPSSLRVRAQPIITFQGKYQLYTTLQGYCLLNNNVIKSSSDGKSLAL